MEVIRSSVDDAAGLETGGVLVGPDRQTGPLLVTHATGPGPGALRGPASFRKDFHWCQGQVAAWHSTMLVDWVGDWHLHPRGQPYPSQVDIDSARRILHDPNLRFSRFLLVIAQPPHPGPFMFHAFMVTPEAVTNWGSCAVPPPPEHTPSSLTFAPSVCTPPERRGIHDEL